MRELTYWQALQEALRQEMTRDPAVFLMGEDIGAYGGAFGVTRGLLAEFGPERVRCTPISEATIVGAAIGAALTGLRPVVEIMFMDFLTLAMDQLANHAAKFRYMYGPQARVPLVVRTPAGGGRCYGATHSQSLEAWFLHVPGLKVVAPATPADAKGLLTAAIRDDNPVLFVEHKLLYATTGPVPEGDTSGHHRPRRRPPCRQRRHAGDVLVLRRHRAQSGRGPRRRGHRRRGRRPAVAGADGHGDDPRLGTQDRPAGVHRGGHAQRRRRRRDRRARRRARLRVSRRARSAASPQPTCRSRSARRSKRRICRHRPAS